MEIKLLSFRLQIKLKNRHRSITEKSGLESISILIFLFESIKLGYMFQEYNEHQYFSAVFILHMQPNYLSKFLASSAFQRLARSEYPKHSREHIALPKVQVARQDVAGNRQEYGDFQRSTMYGTKYACKISLFILFPFLCPFINSNVAGKNDRNIVNRNTIWRIMR